MTYNSKSASFRSHNELKQETDGLAAWHCIYEEYSTQKSKAKQSDHVPANKVGMSGRVNKMGSRKIAPVTKPIGIDHDSAIGSCTDGLCTSSAMLATFFFYVRKISTIG